MRGILRLLRRAPRPVEPDATEVEPNGQTRLSWRGSARCPAFRPSEAMARGAAAAAEPFGLSWHRAALSARGPPTCGGRLSAPARGADRPRGAISRCEQKQRRTQLSVERADRAASLGAGNDLGLEVRSRRCRLAMRHDFQTASQTRLRRYALHHLCKPLAMGLPAEAYVAVSGAAGLASAITFVVRKYRTSPTRDVETLREYVVGSVKYAVGRHVSSVVASQLGLRQYARLRLETFPAHLTVPSLRQQRLPIDEIYISLGLEATDASSVLDQALLDSAAGTALVLGEPGSGKSSLTKKLFRDACRRALSGRQRPRLPVHIAFRDLEWESFPSSREDAAKWITAAVRRSVEQVEGLHDPVFLFEALASGAGLIVFLDGLDEVPAASVGRVIRAVTDAAAAWRVKARHTAVIVTARSQITGVLPRDAVDPFRRIYRIAPFTPADVYLFLRRWPFAADATIEVDRVLDDLQRYPTLAEMCTNPLVLSMYVAQDQQHALERGRTPVRLPDTRTDFYKLVVDELLLYRREDQTGERRGSELRRTREMLLGRIALSHLLNDAEPANSLRWEAAIAAATDILGVESRDAAEHALRELAVDTGVFVEERQGESLSFMHLSICEYLAGRELANLGDAQLETVAVAATTGREQSRRMWESLVFAFALSGRAVRSALLVQLEARGAPAEIALRMIRESQDYEEPTYATAATKLSAALRTASPERWDADWFRELRLLISCIRDSGRVASTRRMTLPLELNAFLAALVGGDTTRLARLFDMFLEVSPGEALRLASDYGADRGLITPARIAARMQTPALVATALARAASDPSGPWTLALCEAALRFPFVASTLHGEDAPAALVDAARTSPAASLWRTNGPLRRESAYRALLVLASARVDSLAAGFERGVPRFGVIGTLARWDEVFSVGPNARRGVVVTLARRAGLRGVGHAPEARTHVELLLLNLHSSTTPRPAPDAIWIVSIGRPEVLLPRGPLEEAIGRPILDIDWYQGLTDAEKQKTVGVVSDLEIVDLAGSSRVVQAQALQQVVDQMTMLRATPSSTAFALGATKDARRLLLGSARQERARPEH